MATKLVSCIVFVLIAHVSTSSHVFHVNTGITFRPDFDAEYFGYSVILSPDGLLVGAPKSKELKDSSTGIKPGMVFNCSLSNLGAKFGSCTAVKRSGRLGNDNLISRLMPGFLRDDMWYGASMVLLPNGRLLVNAPRWTSPYGKKHLLLNGISLLQTRRGNRPLHCLKDYNRQAYVTDGSRREYGAYGTHLNFYAYGQAGMSAAVTKMNTVILGAPGLLQWTGGIISLSFFPNDTGTYTNKLPTMNPYLTKDLGPDDYFGYSVDSGIFDSSGQVLYVAGAPRYNIASGQVVIFEPPTEELVALTIKAKIRGPQTGSYFGASICSTDLNGDGLDDLLVGAPTYVKDDGGLPYDQGAVFVYLSKEQGGSFVLVEHGMVTGSGTNGAWFGLSIVDLGDIDGNGFRDVAIGAPWEDDGAGAVYIYRGCSKGLSEDNVQRIQSKTARGFGWSIAKGVDIDQNNCSDLAIGAHNSQTSYLYRCIPTIKVHASIKVPNAINLPYNTTSFQAEFCISSPPMELWTNVELNIVANIEADPESNRAMISGDPKYRVRVTPGIETCDEQEIEVNPTADLSKPIELVFQLEPDELMKDNSSTFLMNAARLSEDSTLKTSFLIQLMRDCGEDLICTPWLDLTLEALNNPYVPGTNATLGARITIVNFEEPAYAAKVNISLPMSPKRIPSECSLQNLEMVCNVPSPLLRGEKIVWEIELDYEMNHDVNDTEDTVLEIRVELSDPLYRHVTDDNITELFISVKHEANFSISGKAMPNATLSIPRDGVAVGTNFTFKHYFEITNLGPSDSSDLEVFITVPDRTNLSANITGCEPADNTTGVLKCVWSVPAKVSHPVYVPLQMDLSKEGNSLFCNLLQIFLAIDAHWLEDLLNDFFCLFQRGFFQRTTHRMLQEQKNNQRLIQESDSSSGPTEEDQDIPLDDSDEEL
ncbi:hypothetical protein HF086_010804 [Spodoptera exigua]|uniref:Integrin alpha-2 domain-containing protein n=1 Tax=Spodoptera exigua TaxID=7107 RepID=A0A922M994_SPOEX|nr:hypothetical protein HF086_010804 [Spodoptera exigua]